MDSNYEKLIAAFDKILDQGFCPVLSLCSAMDGNFDCRSCKHLDDCEYSTARERRDWALDYVFHEEESEVEDEYS